MEQQKKLGVREVAAAAGVSFSTAAAALRGDSWVRASTKEKVLMFAARLGYQRDAAASILGSRRREKSAKHYSLVYLSAFF